MVEKNIFRPLPFKVKDKLAFSETGMEIEETEDPCWFHLRPIYELFLSLVTNEHIDSKSLKPHISSQFIQEFLGLFDTYDSVERDYLKNILHKLYAKLIPRRKLIRKTINE